MPSKLKNISKTKVHLSIEVPAEQVQKAFDLNIKKVQKDAKIKGFRAGKVPKDILQQYYGPQILSESLNTIVNLSYSEAIQENNLYPVLDPKFDVKDPLEENKAYKYEVEVEVRPEFELKGYTDIPIKKKEAKVEDKEVEVELKKLQESRAELKPAVEGAQLKKGLIATIDFEGKKEGVPFEGGTAKGYVFEFGQGHFIKGFDENLDGMKAGEDKIFNVTFPEDYQEASLQGQEVEFHVKLQSVQEKDLPNLDDEFAKDLGKDKLDDLKKEIQERLLQLKERAFRQDYGQEALEYLAKNHKFDVPEGLLESEMKRAESQKQKKDKKDIEKSIRTQFILEEISKKEEIKVDQKDINQRIQEIAMMYRQPVQEVQKFYYQDQRNLNPLIAQIGMEKTLDFVIDKAKLK